MEYRPTWDHFGSFPGRSGRTDICGHCLQEKKETKTKMTTEVPPLFSLNLITLCTDLFPRNVEVTASGTEYLSANPTVMTSPKGSELGIAIIAVFGNSIRHPILPQFLTIATAAAAATAATTASKAMKSSSGGSIELIHRIYPLFKRSFRHLYFFCFVTLLGVCLHTTHKELEEKMRAKFNV